MRQRLGWILAWMALLALAGVLRLRGADHCLPHFLEPDPNISVQLQLLESGAENPRAVFGWESYPHVLVQAANLATDPLPKPALDAPLEEHLAAASDPILRIRLVSAALSILMVLGTLLLARQLMGPGWTWVAGGLAATSLLAVHFAPQARPHAAAAAFVALALAAAAALATRPSLWRYVLTGALAALALGTLQSAVALGPPLLAAHLLAQRGRPARGHLALLVFLASAALSVVLFYPFFLDAPVESPSSGARLDSGLLVQGGHKVMLDLFNGGGIPVLLNAFAGWEPALCLGTLLALGLGAAGLLRRRALPRPAALVLLAYALPYGLVIALYARSYERFLLPLVPCFAVLSAHGLQQFAAQGPRARRVAAILALLLLGGSGAIAWRLTELRVRPSTIAQAQDWLLARATPATPLVWTPRPYTLPALQKRAAQALDEEELPHRGRSLGWQHYRATELVDAPGPRLSMRFLPVGRRANLLRDELKRDPERYLARLQPAELVMAEVFVDERYLPELSLLTSELRARLPLEARFEPGDGCEHPLAYQDATLLHSPPMAWRVLRSQRLGPVLEVFRLPSPTAQR